MRLFTKSIITIVLCSLAQIACAEEWRPFSVETPPGFEIQIVAEGVVKIDQDRVWFRVESAKLSRPKGVTRETEALAVYIGLAYPLRPPTQDGDTWAILGHPAPISLERVIYPDDELEIEPFEQSWDVGGKDMPENTWVFISVASKIEDTVGYNFAHESGTPTQ